MKPTISNKGQKAIIILLAFIVYSCSSVFSKLASKYDFLSQKYLLSFACVVVSMGIYAILWQKVLSFMALNKAFLCKSITIVFILMISFVGFKETITINNIIGAGLIISGLCILAWKK